MMAVNPSPIMPLFAGDSAADAAALVETLRRRLRVLAQGRTEDPNRNPIQLLALDISRRLERGEIGHGALEAVIQHLTLEGYLARADRFGRMLGETSPEANAAGLKRLFAQAARGADGALLPFEAWQDRLERELYGIVITAHPTFSLSTPLMRGLAALATGRDGDGRPLDPDARQALIDQARRAEHAPDADLSLEREHALSLEALETLRDALCRAYALALDVAREHYPDSWTALTPRLITLATWVGYDLDGRSDIGWNDTFGKRLKVQRGQLARVLREVQALRGLAGPESGQPAELRDTLELMESRLALALNQIADEIDAFADAGTETPAALERLKTVARRMHEGMALRLTEAGALTALIDRAVERASDPDIALRLCVLRAVLANLGLGLAHSHMRINATQVHNGIRKAVGLVTHPNDPRYRQSYLDALTGLLDAVRPVSLNFGSILGERTSLKRLLMVVAQMLKYSDRTAPVRFLIAECESAFTPLTVLYFARMFGIDDRLDICPLFETEKALEAGSRVVEQLLETPHYRAYVQKRGRLCVQTGYSDAGRYLGQTPAAASIERLRLRLVRVMAQSGLEGVSLVIFDTHGESIGRGAHPAGLAERLSYIDTPASRHFMAGQGVAFKQEISFQGGDGYLFFLNPAAAFATVTRILEHALAPPDRARGAEDPFYDEAAYIREIFTIISEFQIGLMEDGNYGVLLSAFGHHLLFPSGSRAFKRQHEDPGEIDHAHASQIRAIPHNAILQQLGLQANVLGGAGAALAKEPEKFRRLYAASPRLRQLLGIVEYGAALSCPDAMQGYIDLFHPGPWIARAAASDDPDRMEDLLRLAGTLEEIGLHERQHRVFRHLAKDLVLLRRELAALADSLEDDEGEGQGQGEDGVRAAGCAALVGADTREALALLHAVRLALMSELFLLAMRVPEFSSRHGATPRQLVLRLLHLDVPAVASLLEEIFPLAEDAVAVADFGEPATYQPDDSFSYQVENRSLFRPMRQLYRLIQRLSTATAHRTGFFG